MSFSINYINDTEIEKDCRSFLSEWFNEHDYIKALTSGSTGSPKVISIRKAAMRISARKTGEYFSFNSDDKILLNLSPKYIAGKMMLVRALEFDMEVVAIKPISNPLLDIPKDLEISFGAFVPMQIQEILSNNKSKVRLEQIANVIIGGAPLSLTTSKELTALRNNCFQTFGMTETISHIALKKINNPPTPYKCLDGWVVSVDDRSCLVIEKNEILASKLVTNDVISQKKSSTFEWLGRFDNVVNSGGVKLYPELLEQKIEILLKGNRFYFTKEKNIKFGEQLILVVEGDKDSFPDLKFELAEILGKYEIPKNIVFESVFNETPTGKVKRR